MTQQWCATGPASASSRGLFVHCTGKHRKDVNMSATLHAQPCCAKCGELLELTAEGDGPPCACGHQRTRCVKWLRVGGIVCPCHLDTEHEGAHMTVFTGRTDEARKTLRRNVRAQLVWVCAEATLRSVEV